MPINPSFPESRPGRNKPTASGFILPLVGVAGLAAAPAGAAGGGDGAAAGTGRASASASASFWRRPEQAPVPHCSPGSENWAGGSARGVAIAWQRVMSEVGNSQRGQGVIVQVHQ